MGFTAKDSGGGNFKRVPPGAYIGRCYSIIDMGTQTRNGQFGEKTAHEIRLGWELFGEDADGQPLTIIVNGRQMPLTVSRTFTVSLHEKANLRKFLSAWRGKDFSTEEAKAFDVSKLLGAYCMVNVTESETNGKTYSNVAGVTPLPGALKNAKPDGVHSLLRFDLDDPDMATFDGFHEKLQDAIKASPEWQRVVGKKPAAVAVAAGDMDDDDVPF